MGWVGGLDNFLLRRWGLRIYLMRIFNLLLSFRLRLVQIHLTMKVVILLCLAAMALADGYVSLSGLGYHYIFGCKYCLTQVRPKLYR